MLGPLLWIGRQLLAQGTVLLRRSPSSPGAGDRTYGDVGVLDPDQDLRRAPDDVHLVAVEIVQVGGRIQRPQVAVRQEWIRCGEVKSPRKHGLEGVSGGDVLPDSAHVLLEAAVGIGTRGSGQLRRGLDLQGDQRHRSNQTPEPAIDARPRLIVQPAQLFSRRARRHLDVGNHCCTVEEVVQHEQGVDHHQKGVGQVPVVRGRLGQGLDAPDDVVTQKTHGASCETRQPGHFHGWMPAHHPAEVIERGHVGLHQLPAVLRGPSGALPALVAEHLLRVRGQEGVAGPALAALE
jgi:hypothetical protein